MTTGPLDREVGKRLDQHAVRYTRGRRHVVTTLAGADGPLSAAEIHGRMDGELPLSSLYRSLSVLEEADVVAPHHSKKGLTRYELAEWLRGHHHHLVCIDCGAVDDVEVADEHEEDVDRIVNDISRAASFTPVSHALEIEGRCARCA
ncbi:MAG: transcriptional repressor [Acidimicrobiia bacterium]|nr:transcriptional repressor [Acidimicrobiia bacterium]